MDMDTFLGLEPAGELRWRLPVVPRLLTPGNFLFGGAGLAAAVTALERAAGRPLIWATAQYLSYTGAPAVLDVDVRIAAEGRTVTQGRCTISKDGVEILTVNGALGSRQSVTSGSWAERPDVPPPDHCRSRMVPELFRGSIVDEMEMRLAAGRPMESLDGVPGGGRSAYWTRLPGGSTDMGAAALAVMGDHVPSGISQALGVHAGGNSLDNTLRVVQLVPTEWVLLDIRIHAIHAGFAHGLVHLWAEDGTLLGTASQSAIVRAFPLPRTTPPEQPLS